MKKVAIIILAFITLITSLAGCSTNRDKEKLLNWMHSINVENTEAYFWWGNGEGELLLSEDDAQALVAILSEIKAEDITWNKERAGITPQYGLHLYNQRKAVIKISH